MGFNLSIFESGGGSSGSGQGIAKYPSAANLPLVAQDGDIAIVLDTNVLYSYDTGVGAWVVIGGPGIAITVTDTSSINLDLTTNILMADLNIGATTLPANTQGISLLIQPTGSTGLYGYFPAGPISEVTSSILQFSGPGKVVGFSLGIQVNAASGLTPGYVTTAGQTFGGAKTFGSVITGFSGVNFPLGGQILSLGVPSGVTTYPLLLPKDTGSTYAMWLASGSGGVTLSTLGDLTRIQGSNNVYLDARNFTTVQAAVNYAETLVAADTAPGVCVVLPAGSFAENVNIKKNVSLMGSGRKDTFLQRLTIRPTSNVVAPIQITLAHMQIGDGTGVADLVVSNETASGSGIYNSSMLIVGGLTIANAILAKVDITDIGILSMFSCELLVTQTLNNVNNAEMVGCFFADTILSGNDASAGSNGNGTNFYSDLSSFYTSVTTSKGGGSANPAFTAFNSNISSLIIGANTDVAVTGGTVGSRSGTPTVWNCTSPYTPATSGNWATQPTNVDQGLDYLAARMAGGVTFGTFLYAGSAKGATITTGSTFQNLSLTWGDTTNPGGVGTTHQVWSGDKDTTGNLGTFSFLRFRGASLVSIGSTAASGYTLILPTSQGATLSVLRNNGLGFLDWTYATPGFYRTVTNAGATLLLQDRYIEITTGSTNQTLNVGWGTGFTGVPFTVQKIDSGLGTVTLQSSRLINGVTNFTFTSQWETHSFVDNGVGVRVIN